MSKIRSIFGKPPKDRFGCGFLTRRDIDEILESRFDEARQERFEEHQREGCTECLYLAAALEQFTRILKDGVLGIEAEQFSEIEQGLRINLRREYEKIFARNGLPVSSLPWAREVSTDDLEHIAAAGPDGPRNGFDRDPDDDDRSTH